MKSPLILVACFFMYQLGFAQNDSLEVRYTIFDFDSLISDSSAFAFEYGKRSNFIKGRVYSDSLRNEYIMNGYHLFQEFELSLPQGYVVKNEQAYKIIDVSDQEIYFAYRLGQWPSWKQYSYSPYVKADEDSGWIIPKEKWCLVEYRLMFIAIPIWSVKGPPTAIRVGRSEVINLSAHYTSLPTYIMGMRLPRKDAKPEPGHQYVNAMPQAIRSTLEVREIPLVSPWFEIPVGRNFYIVDGKVTGKPANWRISFMYDKKLAK